MTSLAGILRRNIFGISPDETTFARRAFPGKSSAVREHLERVGQIFVQGYQAAMENYAPDAIQRRLEAVETESQGFAYEGAAMALAMLDILMPWRRHRAIRFLHGPGARHTYMVHVGIGFALARLRRRAERTLSRLDRLLGWLVVDGYGFHEGYFHWRRSFEDKRVPDRLTGYARRVFDQGLGRSLWFVAGAETDRIASMIESFDADRHADLWSGVGLACAYAGGVGKGAIKSLRDFSGRLSPHVAQGAAFAAKARQRAGNPTAHTELACDILCELSAEKAAEITDAATVELPFDGTDPAYELWRRRIAERMAKSLQVGNQVQSVGV